MTLKNPSTFLLCLVAFTCFISLSNCKNGRSSRSKPSDSSPPQSENRNRGLHPVHYNFYLDNSYSMNGYMKGESSGQGSRFRVLISNLLVDLNNLNTSKKINLFYINLKPHKLFVSDSEFIQNKTLFENTGSRAERQSSKLNDILSTIIKSTDSLRLSILITDGIYSINKSTNKPVTNLNLAASDTRKIILNSIEYAPYLSVCVIKCVSNYDGTYHSESNNSNPAIPNKLRPYYLWLFGSLKNIDAVVAKIKQAPYAAAGVYINEIVYFTNLPDPKNTLYNISYKERQGSRYRISRDMKSVITDATKDRDGKFHFSVLADFRNIRVDGKYLKDSNNYIISPSYKIFSIQPDTSDPNFTHLITFETNDLQTTDFKLILKNRLPEWVDSSSSDNDDNILSSDQINKTFGLKYLIHAVDDAYKDNGKNIAYCDISIKINTDKGSSPFSFIWIIVVIVIIIGIIWFLKNKK